MSKNVKHFTRLSAHMNLLQRSDSASSCSVISTFELLVFTCM